MPEHLSWRDRLAVEDLRPQSGDAVFGEAEVDLEACTGCGMCARVCPAHTLELHDKKARMVLDLPMCMSCGDCVAACPEGAIAITRFIEFHKFFRYLDRGRPEPPRKF